MRKVFEKCSMLLSLLSMVLCLYQVSAIACIDEEREALLQLKKSVIKDPSHRLASWNGTDCCNWDGVGCNQTTQHVTELDLRNYQVYSASALSSTLFQLKYLNYLDLSGNNFNPTQIPNSLSSMLELRYLNLRGSSIYGPIPASLGNLSSLESLDLSNNALTGAIPSSLGRLLNLRELNLSTNRLDEVGKECFIQLRNLEMLDISENLLKAVLTEADFANLSQLQSLSIGYNDGLLFDMKSNWVPPFQLKYLDARSCVGCFGTEFPQWLQTQKTLFKLLLPNMNISSAFPTWLRSAAMLTHLDLSYNQIVGSLPTNIVDQMPDLKQLFLNDNLIDGFLPTSLCELKFLQNLDLSNNKLSGMVKGCLLTSQLLVLDLSSNKFSGIIPYSRKIDLSNNRLSEMAQECASYLQQLYLGNNNFEGFIPIVLKNSIYLQLLDLEGNRFSGNIPTWVGDNLKNLRVLRLRGNLFNGTIPSNLCNLTSLQILDLAHNQLEGSIPSNLDNFYIMMEKGKSNRVGISCFFDERCVYIDHNFRQSIKSRDFNYSLLNLRLVNIDLSKNYLVGHIPKEITMLKGLIGLNLSHNNLTGTIPAKIGGMESLNSLDLSFNQLSGSIPRSISELNSLGVLKLSHNNLSEVIPREGHLSTFNEASSFDGNPYLCGDPLPKKCGMIENPFEPPPFEIENVDEEEEDKWEKWLLYIMIILGYAIGFWAVVGCLILKRSWRYSYFKFVDETKYKVDVAMWWSIQMLKRICTHK